MRLLPINSKKKGSAGEREWAKFCREEGYEVRRTQQYSGGTEESADCIGLPGIHQEVKRVEALNIDKAMEQATRDSETLKLPAEDRIPIVAHRRNGKSWKVTMYAEDWFKLYREWEASMELKKR